MKHFYCVAYKIDGAFAPLETTSFSHGKSTRVSLSSDLSHIQRQFFQAAVIPSLILRQAFGQLDGNFADVVEEETSNHIARICKDTGKSCCLTIFCEGDDDRSIPTIIRSLNGYRVAVKNKEPEDNIPIRYSCLVSNALTSFAITATHFNEAKLVLESTYYHDENEMELYLCALTGSAYATTSSPLPNDFAKEFQKAFESLSSVASFKTPARLLSASYTQKNDRLASFLSAWMGLEILVNKIFPEYEKIFSASIGAHSSVLSKRIREVMKDKYKITDKFSLISSHLSSQHEEDDLTTFKKLKLIRDNLIHGEPVDQSQLPTEVVQLMLRKYLYLHLQA
ncbi:MAG: hypothetical protein ACREO1_14805 [Arenimonas sp.]